MKDKTKNVEMNFTVFISGLLAEGLVALGLMKNPVTQQIQKDLQHAGMVIDTLTVLKEKTRGNLTKDESDSLEQILSQLRMGYVAEVDRQTKEENKEQNEK